MLQWSRFDDTVAQGCGYAVKALNGATAAPPVAARAAAPALSVTVVSYPP